MKVEIKVLPELKEPYAVIYAGRYNVRNTPRRRHCWKMETPDVIPGKGKRQHNSASPR